MVLPKMWRRAAILCLLSSMAMDARAGSAVVRPTDKASALLNALWRTNGVPGMSAAVWRGGRLVWKGASGFRDLDAGLPLTLDTRFPLASELPSPLTLCTTSHLTPSDQVSRLYDLKGGLRHLDTARGTADPPHAADARAPTLTGTAESIARRGSQMLSRPSTQRSKRGVRPTPQKNEQASAKGEHQPTVGSGQQPFGSMSRSILHDGNATTARNALLLWPEQQATAALLSNAHWATQFNSTLTLLVTPFLPPPKGLPQVPCPVNSTQYRGLLGDTPISGGAQVRWQQGICVAVLDTDATLGAHFAIALAWPDQQLRLVGLDDAGGLSHAALATPLGLYEVRAHNQETLSTHLSPTAQLRFAFVPS